MSKIEGKAMFCISKHNSTLMAYKNHAYHVYKPKFQGLKPQLVNKIISSCETMLSHYSKVMVVRIDLHPQQFSADNNQISQFLDLQVEKLSKQYKCKVQYLCARERHHSETQHYHVALMLSGHKIHYPHKLLNQLKSQWERAGGTASLVDSPFNIMRRGNKPSLKNAIYRLSYFAKAFTKELNIKARTFLSNKLQPSATFDDTKDILLVNPLITFEMNQQKKKRENTDNAVNTINNRRWTTFAWFNELSHAQQLKESISSRTSSLHHIVDQLLSGSQLQHPMNR